MAIKLPSLPVPSLDNLLAQYKKHTKFLQYSHGYRLSEIDASISKFEKFISSELASTLQSRLEERAKHEDNWLDGLWEKWAYMSYREPLVPHSNWWMYFIRSAPNEKGPFNRAAEIAFFSIQYFKEELCKLDQDRLSNEAPLCMRQYSRMFGFTRIPHLNFDYLYESKSKASPHFLLILHLYGKVAMFKIFISEISSLDQMEKIIQTVSINSGLAHESLVANESDPLIYSEDFTMLTSLHRDDWAIIREELVNIPGNKKRLKMIEDSLFNITIDLSSTVPEEAPKSIFPRKIFLDNKGMWLDKALSFIVCNNGDAGLNGEHSPCDALIPSKIVDYIIKNSSNLKKPCKGSITKNMMFTGFEPVSLILPKCLRDNIQSMRDAMSIWKSYIQLEIFDCSEIGSSLVKAAKLPPDSIAQAIIVLAYYMNSKEKRIPVTYETASTRRFRHGRTENIRVLSENGYNWSKVASKPTSSLEELSDLLEKFVTNHIDVAKNASLGNGFDRHFLGLRKVAKDNEQLEPRELFESDKVLSSMFLFEMSTSNMSPGNSFQGLGFGTFSPSGYGVNYCISESRFLFSVSAWELDQATQTYPMFNCPRFDKNGQNVCDGEISVPKEYFRLQGPTRAEEFKKSLHVAVDIMRKVLEFRIKKSRL